MLPCRRPAAATARELSLNNVEFSYTAEKPVLRGVSVRIAPGQMVGFVGPSAWEEHAAATDSAFLYDATSGSVTLDDVDIRNVRLGDLRRHIALVPQDSLLLPTTVAENIAYGRPGASAAEIRAAAELAGA